MIVDCALRLNRTKKMLYEVLMAAFTTISFEQFYDHMESDYLEIELLLSFLWFLLPCVLLVTILHVIISFRTRAAMSGSCLV